jgi:Flp pilus assembly protein TadD
MARFFWSALLSSLAAGFVAAGAAADDLSSCGDSTASGDERIAACTRVIESGKDLKWALVSRGNANFDIGNNDNAIANYTEAMRIDPKFATGLNNRAYAYLAQGDFDRALVDAKKAVQLEPRDPSFVDTRGAIYQKTGALDRAIADFGEAIRLDPRFVGALTRRGLAFEAKGEIARARADYRAALALPPKYKSGTWALDTARDHLTALDAARQHLTALPPPAGPANAVQGPVINRDEAPASPASGSAAMPPALEKSPAPPASTSTSVATAPPAPPVNAAPARPAVPVLTPAPAVNASNSTVAAVLPAATPAKASSAEPTDSIGAARGRRVALVIGNSNYAVLPSLPTPQHDAADLTTVLKGLGFEVLTGVDLKRLEMEETLIRFARLARDAETALVYYAGHGIQHEGENYLAPVDAVLEDEADLRKLTNLREIVGDLQGASRGRILILDACRDDAVVTQAVAKLPSARAVAFGTGLAWVSEAAGTLVVFAAQVNHTAADGTARNSPFTQALLKQLPTAGVELRTVMTRVRSDVVAATKGAQRPELFDSLVGEFVLRAQ